MKYTSVVLLFIGAISSTEAIQLEHHHHHKNEGHQLGGTKGVDTMVKSLAQSNDCINDPNQATCDQYVPVALSDVSQSHAKKSEVATEFKLNLDQKLAQHEHQSKHHGHGKSHHDHHHKHHSLNQKGKETGAEAKTVTESTTESTTGSTIEAATETKEKHVSDLLNKPLCTEPTTENMAALMDAFSRTFDRAYYNKAMEISNRLKIAPSRVTTWELYDKAFTFPRVRNYDLVKEQMDILEHYEDNLNTNISNNKLVDDFITHATAVHAAIKEKYEDAAGGFNDPVAPVLIPESESTM